MSATISPTVTTKTVGIARAPRPRSSRALVAGAVVLAILAVAGALSIGWSRALAETAPVATPDAGVPATAPGNGAAAARSPNVKIIFKINPPTRATVSWGKKRLGLIKGKEPLIVERPRDSGPLDVVVRADGCLPVHTRAYTFTTSVVQVKVTPIDKKNTLFGYREEVTEADGGTGPGPGSTPDGGVAPPTP